MFPAIDERNNRYPGGKSSAIGVRIGFRECGATEVIPGRVEKATTSRLFVAMAMCDDGHTHHLMRFPVRLRFSDWREDSIEDTVANSVFRARETGRVLMEHKVGFASRELVPIVLGLASRLKRDVRMRCIGSWDLRRGKQ